MQTMLCMDGKDVFLGGAFDDTADLKVSTFIC